MLWLRNLLFLGLVAGGLTALAANLIPPRTPQLLTEYERPREDAENLRPAVERVDALLVQQREENSVSSTAPAPDLLVARRLALGLMGTVPSLEELRQFETLPSGQRLDWWLDQILNDRRSHDYLAERLARAYVGTEDGPFILYRRRRFVAWLADQLAANRPYDQIVRELITGHGLWTDQPSVNFISVTSQQEMKNQPDPIRLAGRTTRAFLGLRIDCAECHHHPFAGWKQDDFHGLAAFFGQTHVGFTGIYDGNGEFEAEDRKTQEKKVIAPQVPFSPEWLPAEGTRREKLAAWVTDRRNPFFSRAIVNRIWALMLGRPLVEPVDNFDPEAEPPPMLVALAEDFAEHGHDLRRLIRVIASSRAFRLDSRSDHEVTGRMEETWAVFPLTRLRPEQVSGSILQSASVSTVDADSHILVRLMRYGQQNEFITRYGDTGEDEYEGRGGTIPQRLLLMNGKMVRERIEQSPLNAATRLAWMASTDERAIEMAYLACLTRRPTPAEREHFTKALAEPGLSRPQKLEDLFWALLNATEYSWNH